MPPKKGKRKNTQEEDKQFAEKEKQLEMMLAKVNNKSKKNKLNVGQNHFQVFGNFDEQQQSEVLLKPKKQVFAYDTSTKNEQKIQEQLEKVASKNKAKQLEQAKKLQQMTPQQRSKLQKQVEKKRLEKEKKQLKKEEKKQYRLKTLEQERKLEQSRKIQQQKQTEEVQRRIRMDKTKSSGKWVPLILFGFLLFLCALQYQKEIYTRLNKFKLDDEENYYETLEVDSGATDRQLKEKYKRLVLKYHPDKNPNCKECPQKFNKIIKAWEILGSVQKRKHYDANSGFITQIKSESITLTPQNYAQLVQDRPSLWIIQVYDSTEKYCHYFSQFWQEVVGQYKDFVKFGRVDVWTQTDMLSYLPYRFQVFPSIYFYHKGEVGLCPFDFQQPDWSVKRCIQTQYRQNIVIKIQTLTQVDLSLKPAVVFAGGMKLGSRFKMVNKKYQDKFNFYELKETEGKAKISPYILALSPQGTNLTLEISQNSEGFYQKYERFLESLFCQRVSICELIENCEDYPCFVYLKQPKHSGQTSQQLQLPRQQPLNSKPVYQIEEHEFYQMVEKLKNSTEGFEFQAFQIGLYMNGHIDMGYLDESQLLRVQQGQNFHQLQCIRKDYSWSGRLGRLLSNLKQTISSLWSES